MFIGHYGVGLAAKGFDRRIPLWVLFLAAQFVDVLWAVLVWLGVEKMRIVPGFTASNGLDNVYIPFTHGAVPTIIWGMVGICLYQGLSKWRGWGGSAALVGAVVVSHWMLDLLVHVPDLPLVGDRYKVGCGLWHFRGPSYLAELVLLLSGGAVWIHAVWGRSGRVGRRVAAGMLVVLVALATYNYFGPAQATVGKVVGGALSVYAGVACVTALLEKKKWIP